MLRVPATLLEVVGYIVLTLLWCTSRVSSSACWFAPSRFTSSAPDDGDIGSSPRLVGLVPFVLVIASYYVSMRLLMTVDPDSVSTYT